MKKSMDFLKDSMKSKVREEGILKLHQEIEKTSEIIEKYFNKNPDMKKNIPDTKLVVYNRIAYPIIYEINHFYYLGGKNLYMVMKSKCLLKNTGKVYYYEAIASEQDIELGKSPIIPQGCVSDKNIVYPDDTVSLERKV